MKKPRQIVLPGLFPVSAAAKPGLGDSGAIAVLASP